MNVQMIMDHFNTGIFPFLTVWWLLIGHVSSQYQSMVCEKLNDRQGRTMTMPGPECDMTTRNYCTQKTSNYPEEKIMEIILDHRGIMKKLFGDSREARFLESAFENDVLSAPEAEIPPAPKLRWRRKKNPTKEVHSRTSEGDIFAQGASSESDEWIRKRRVITVSAYDGQTSDDPERKRINDIEEEKKSHRPNDRTFSTAFSVTEEKLRESDFTSEGTTSSPVEGSSTMINLDDVPMETTTKETNTIESVTSLPVSSTDEQSLQKAQADEEKPIDKGDDHVYESLERSTIKLANLDQPEKHSSNLNLESKHTATVEEMTIAWNAKVKASPAARVEFPNTFPEKIRQNTRQKYPTRIHQDTQRLVPEYGENPQRRDQVISTPSTVQQTTQHPPTYDAPPPRPNFMVEKFQACNSTTEIIAPTWARNLKGKNLIVVNVGSFMQHLHVEECTKDTLYRKKFCRTGCRCEQQYRLQKLLVIDPDDECRGIFSEWFRFPSCCGCMCYKESMQGRNARIMEDDYEIYHEGDEDEDSYDEYVVDNEDPMKTSASSSPTYASYTNPESIDRSYPGIPLQARASTKISANGPYFNHLNHNMGLHTKQNKPRSQGSNSGDLYHEKISKLLKWTNGTVNIRPQVAPRRNPPVRSFLTPWFRSPSKSLWPSLDYYRRFPSISSFRPNAKFTTDFISPVTSSVKFGLVTPAPTHEQAVTLGTLSAATKPFYSWSWRVPKSLTPSRDGTSLSQRVTESKLVRLPRTLRDV